VCEREEGKERVCVCVIKEEGGSRQREARVCLAERERERERGVDGKTKTRRRPCNSPPQTAAADNKRADPPTPTRGRYFFYADDALPMAKVSSASTASSSPT
jgi:hypothetical protein